MDDLYEMTDELLNGCITIEVNSPIKSKQLGFQEVCHARLERPSRSFRFRKLPQFR